MKALDGDGRYRAVLMLPKGQHEYKFVIGGDWQHDGGNPHTLPNSYGSLNSVIEIA